MIRYSSPGQSNFDKRANILASTLWRRIFRIEIVLILNDFVAVVAQVVTHRTADQKVSGLSLHRKQWRLLLLSSPFFLLSCFLLSFFSFLSPFFLPSFFFLLLPPLFLCYHSFLSNSFLNTFVCLSQFLKKVFIRILGTSATYTLETDQVHWTLSYLNVHIFKEDSTSRHLQRFRDKNPCRYLDSDPRPSDLHRLVSAWPSLHGFFVTITFFFLICRSGGLWPWPVASAEAGQANGLLLHGRESRVWAAVPRRRARSGNGATGTYYLMTHTRLKQSYFLPRIWTFFAKVVSNITLSLIIHIILDLLGLSDDEVDRIFIGINMKLVFWGRL